MQHNNIYNISNDKGVRAIQSNSAAILNAILDIQWSWWCEYLLEHFRKSHISAINHDISDTSIYALNDGQCHIGIQILVCYLN